MKIRTDFVSNSSSSSFVIFGKIFSKDEVYDKCIIDAECHKQYEDGEIDELELSEEIINKAEELGLYVETAGYDSIDEYCIGLNPAKMKDNETLHEFKDKAIEKIKKLGLNVAKKDVRFISGGSDASGLSFFESCG